MRVRVKVFESYRKFDDWCIDPENVEPMLDYVMNHDNEQERKRWGVGCREAFAAGQVVVTFRDGIE